MAKDQDTMHLRWQKDPAALAALPVTSPEDADFIRMERQVLALYETGVDPAKPNYDQNLDRAADLNDAILLMPPTSLTAVAVKLRRLACPYSGVDINISEHFGVAARQMASFLSVLTGGPMRAPQLIWDSQLDVNPREGRKDGT